MFVSTSQQNKNNQPQQQNNQCLAMLAAMALGGFFTYLLGPTFFVVMAILLIPTAIGMRHSERAALPRTSTSTERSVISMMRPLDLERTRSSSPVWND